LGRTDVHLGNEKDLSAWIPVQGYSYFSENAKFIHRNHLNVNSYLCGSSRRLI
jgi:hypothetical protein